MRVLTKNEIKKHCDQLEARIVEFEKWYERIEKILIDEVKVGRKSMRNSDSVEQPTIKLENLESVHNRYMIAVDNLKINRLTDEDFNVLMNSVAIYQANMSKRWAV